MKEEWKALSHSSPALQVCRFLGSTSKRGNRKAGAGWGGAGAHRSWQSAEVRRGDVSSAGLKGD